MVSLRSRAELGYGQPASVTAVAGAKQPSGLLQESDGSTAVCPDHCLPGIPKTNADPGKQKLHVQ